VTDAVIQEALAAGANWLIVHHPLIYKPLTALNLADPSARLAATMIKHDLNLYVAHTNLDIAEAGVNDILADRIGLQQTRPLIPTYTDKLQKLVVFLPREYRQPILQALAGAGAGIIGNYSHCAFGVDGIGNFKPLTGSNPTIGDVEQL